MRDLKTLREVGEAMNREELELPFDLTIEQSVKIFASLYNDDVPGIIRRQKKNLDDNYIEYWLREFEIALADSTLVRSYRQMRQTIP